MKPFERLAIRLNKELDLDCDNFKRVYAGYWQRAQGAWSWGARIKGKLISVGSQWNVKECLKAVRLEIYRESWNDISIFPEQDAAQQPERQTDDNQ